MRKEQVWSVSIDRVQQFFCDQADVLPAAEGFRFHSCRIMLTQLPPSGEGIWKICRTKLTLDGDDADVSAIYHRFFLQFLSTGG